MKWTTNGWTLEKPKITHKRNLELETNKISNTFEGRWAWVIK